MTKEKKKTRVLTQCSKNYCSNARAMRCFVAGIVGIYRNLLRLERGQSVPQTSPRPRVKARPVPRVKARPVPRVKARPVPRVKARPVPRVKARPVESDNLVDPFVSEEEQRRYQQQKNTRRRRPQPPIPTDQNKKNTRRKRPQPPIPSSRPQSPLSKLTPLPRRTTNKLKKLTYVQQVRVKRKVLETCGKRHRNKINSPLHYKCRVKETERLIKEEKYY